MISMKPDGYFVSLLDIDPSMLKERGYKAVLLDLDNTLLPYGKEDISNEIVAWVQAVQQEGLSVMLVSNTAKQRAVSVAGKLNVPVVRNAMKPLTGGFVKACAALGIPCRDAVMIGDQCYTDVLGAHRVGMDAFLVVPQSGADPLHTHVLRALDRCAVRGMRAVGGRS